MSRIYQVALPHEHLPIAALTIANSIKLITRFERAVTKRGLPLERNSEVACDWLSSRFVHLDILTKHARISRGPVLSL